jgi:hypothetical protein
VRHIKAHVHGWKSVPEIWLPDRRADMSDKKNKIAKFILIHKTSVVRAERVVQKNKYPIPFAWR